MKVRAIRPGFYGGSYRVVGDEFEVERGHRARWFEPVGGKPSSDGPASVSQPKKKPSSDGSTATKSGAASNADAPI